MTSIGIALHEEVVVEKKCFRCKRMRKVEKFSPRTDSSDGLQSWCKECMKDYAYVCSLLKGSE